MTDNLPAVRQDAAYPEIRREHTDDWIAVVKPVAELAEQVANTEFVPAGLRGKPAAITAALLFGRELNIAPMHALAGIHMVEGKPTLAAEELRAMVLAAGHEIGYGEVSSARCAVKGRRVGSSEWTIVVWTIADAQNAGLAGKSNWKKYPRQMLVARATAELCRMIFADVTHGVRATEELEDGGNAGPAVDGQSAARTTVQRKSRTTKTDNGAAAAADAPAAGGSPAAPSSPPMPPLPGEPGYDDGIDTPALAGEVATSTTEPHPPQGSGPADASDPGSGSAVSDRRVSGRSVEVPPGQASQTDDGAGPPPDGHPARATSSPAPSSPLPPLPGEEDMPPEEDFPPESDEITDAQRGKLFALMGEHGLASKDQQIGWMSKNLGREITSRAQVNKDDAIKLIDLLESLGVDTPRPIGRGDLRLLAGLFRDLAISDMDERLHIASSIVGRTPMKDGTPSPEGLTAAEGKTLLDGLARCKTRDHVEALVQMAEQERAQGGAQS